jgi:DNA-3-methyladenine glycosylase
MGRRDGRAALNPIRPGKDLAALLAGGVVTAARALLGARVSAGGVTVRLTEVEAYDGVGQDPASHAYRGPGPRNAAMFGPPGHLYVYFTYGMHWCANIVCGPSGEAAAVLLRAGEVVEGVEIARGRRRSARSDRDLARGPARLAMVLGIDGARNGARLLDPGGGVTLSPPVEPLAPSRVSAGPRVGVNGGADIPWRFWIDGDPTVSPYRRNHRDRR